MSAQLTISDMGLRLIKAYEGFHPAPRDLVSGERIIGFGHRVIDDESDHISEDDAEALLKRDLEHVEEFINSLVHTSLTQSQFDALCSLIYSIGPEAFLTSDIYHSLNQGHHIEAANGFDAWRLSQIAGETYMVDALVRRRTAEKALFLRPSRRLVPASRLQIPPQMDPDVIPDSFSTWSREKEELQVVETAPVFETENAVFTDHVEANDTLELEEERTSPIAEAAADVSARLDALMDEPAPNDVDEDWPDTLVDVPQDDNIVEFHPPANDGADRLTTTDEAGEPSSGLWVYVIMALLGLAAAITGIWLGLEGSASIFGQWGPFVTFVSIFIGALLFMAGAYYVAKTLWKQNF